MSSETLMRHAAAFLLLTMLAAPLAARAAPADRFRDMRLDLTPLWATRDFLSADVLAQWLPSQMGL